ncbi:MAG: serine protease [Candidatus Obscuribacterales bacterium]|jgi:S1-C subfamily serine protease|nr:serine protease [Candidatus Obscuribacterales bacterium]
MDQNSNLEQERPDKSSQKLENLSLLSLAHTEEEKQSPRGHASPTQFERDRVLQVLNRFLKPIDTSIDCDRSPQVPMARTLQNTCGIDLVNAFDKVKGSTVKVIGPNHETLGSGVYACSEDKQLCAVVSNDHVVSKASNLSKFSIYQEGVGVSAAEVIVQDKKNDLALLQVKTPEYINPLFPQTNLKPVKWAPNLQQGESIFSVCSPSAVTYSTFVSPGKATFVNTIPIIIDAPNAPRSIIGSQENYPGCSGGATFNKFGELVGIVRAVGADMVSIQAKNAIKLLNEESNLRMGQAPPAAPTQKRSSRPY